MLFFINVTQFYMISYNLLSTKNQSLNDLGAVLDKQLIYTYLMKITHCKLKHSIQKKLLEFFIVEVTARLLGINPNSAALFYRKIREVIRAHLSLEANEVFEGAIELDESYFGGVRKGKRGRGAAGKVAVFGLLKRQGKVYTVVVADTKSETLMPIITRKIKLDS